MNILDENISKNQRLLLATRLAQPNLRSKVTTANERETSVRKLWPLTQTCLMQVLDRYLPA